MLKILAAPSIRHSPFLSAVTAVTPTGNSLQVPWQWLCFKETKDSAPCFAVILGTCGSSLKFKQTPLAHAKNRNIKEFAYTADCRVAQTCF